MGADRRAWDASRYTGQSVVSPGCDRQHFLTDQAKETAAPAPASKEPGKLAALDQKLDALSKNLTITTGDPNFKVVFGGAITTDFLHSSARRVAPGTPFFLTFGRIAGFRQQTFDVNAAYHIIRARFRPRVL
jgi:hypothetical protein